MVVKMMMMMTTTEDDGDDDYADYADTLNLFKSQSNKKYLTVKLIKRIRK